MITRAVKRASRHALFDSNWWKTFLFDRFAVSPGDKGSLSLFGTEPHAHHLLGEHLTAEYPLQLESKAHGDRDSVRGLSGARQPLARYFGRQLRGGFDGRLRVALDRLGHRPCASPPADHGRRHSPQETSMIDRPEPQRHSAGQPSPDHLPGVRKKVNPPANRGLQCRVCGCQHLEVSHTERLKNGTIRRRRTCRHCGAKYVTFEGL
jgi:hypothetical protein